MVTVGDTTAVPLARSLVENPPRAVQLVAFEDVQLSVDDEPLTIVAGFEEIEAVGTGLLFTQVPTFGSKLPNILAGTTGCHVGLSAGHTIRSVSPLPLPHPFSQSNFHLVV